MPRARFTQSQRELSDANEQLRVDRIAAQRTLERLAAAEQEGARLRGEARNREAKCVALADQLARAERAAKEQRGALSAEDFAVRCAAMKQIFLPPVFVSRACHSVIHMFQSFFERGATLFMQIELDSSQTRPQ